MAGYTRDAVSCTFSTTGFQNSRNKMQALLAEAFGNSSVWSQHVTNGIINVLYSIPLRDILEPKQKMQKSIRLALAMAWNFPWEMYILSRSPKGEKVMLIVSTWWMSSEGPKHKNKHDQWNSATNSCCFFHIQVCKFLLKMQPMNWYEWVRCGSWRLQGSSPHKGRRHLANGMPRVRLDEKQHMNMTWLRTPQFFLARRFQMHKKNSTFWPTHLPRAVPIPKLILASLEVEDLVFHWGIGQTVLYPRSLWYRNLWTLAAWGQRQGG